MTTHLEKLLEPYRQASIDRDALAIEGDKEALKILSAWPHVTKRWTKPAGKPAVDNNVRWLWLWSGCYYDHKALAKAVRLSERKTLKAIRAVALARLIYPDGTISTAAETAIDNRPTKRGPGRPPKEKT